MNERVDPQSDLISASHPSVAGYFIPVQCIDKNPLEQAHSRGKYFMT
jgi:hypothetical protein